MEAMMSVKAAAELKQVNKMTIWRILWDDSRRAQIFPGAVKIGEGKRAIWLLVPEEVERWQPEKPGGDRRRKPTTP